MTVLGKITEIEKRDITQLMGRKGALEDLFIVLGRQAEIGVEANTAQLYERIVNDMQQVKSEISDWWITVSTSHSWEYGPSNVWNINFDTDEVFLV